MEKKSIMSAIAAGPIFAPILALLGSRTFISAVIAFGVHQLVIHDPSSAAYEGPIQLILLVMWLALAGKFSIEYVVDSWSSKPSSADQAQSDIASELSKALKALVDAVINSQLPAPQTTVNVGSPSTSGSGGTTETVTFNSQSPDAPTLTPVG